VTRRSGRTTRRGKTPTTTSSKKLSIIYKDRIIEVKSKYRSRPIKEVLDEYGITGFNKIYIFDGFFLKELDPKENIANLLNGKYIIYVE
jgi:hypothetical protein